MFLGSDGATSQQAPFYPFLLAGAYGLFGIGSPAAFLTVQLLQCLAGTLTALCTVWLAWSFLPKRKGIGWIAGIGVAVHPVHVYMVTQIQVVTWATLFLALLIAIVISPRWQGRWSGAALAGLIGGALLLIEPIFALVTPITALMFWRNDISRIPRRSSLSPGPLPRVPRIAAGPLSRIVLMATVSCLIVAPWTWRNYRVHQEFVFIKSTFGYAFWQGNNPVSRGTDKVSKPSVEQIRNQHDGSLLGQDRALVEARRETLYIDDVLLKPHGYREFAGLSEPQRSRLLGRRAWEFITRQPGQYFRLCLNRLRYFLLFDETNPRAAHPIYRISTVLWLAFSAIGLWITRTQWRTLWPTYSIFAVITAFHTLTIVSSRFRIPLEPLSFVWAAAAVAAMAGLWNAATYCVFHREQA